MNKFGLNISRSINKISNCSIRRLIHEKPKSSHDSWNSYLAENIKSLNQVVSEYPQTSMISFTVMRSSTWFLLFYVLNSSILFPSDFFSAELAIGYLTAKFSGKFRQPANVILAGILSKQFPILSDIKVSSLLGAVTITPVNESQPPDKMSQFFKQVTDKISGPMDQYGFAYLVAGKINVLLTIVGTATAISAGMDIKSLLLSLGVSDSIQNGAGAMGAATLCNLVILPFHFQSLIRVVPLVDSYNKLFDTVNSKNKSPH